MSRIGPNWLACLLLLAVVGGCSGNVVRLGYPDLGSVVSPTAGPLVAVVEFANHRQATEVGRKLDGQPLLGRSLVESWMAESLAAELERGGYRVRVARSLAEAVAMTPDFIVGGEVEEVWLTEVSFTRYAATIRATISLMTAAGVPVTRNSYNSVYSRTVLPVYGVPQTLLGEALHEMLQPAAALLMRTMQLTFVVP